MATDFPTKIWDGLKKVNVVNGSTPDAPEWDQMIEELQAMQKRATAPDIGNGVEAGNGTANEKAPTIHTTVLTIAGTQLMTDATTAGTHGGAKIYDFPLGVIKIHSVKTDVNLVSDAAGLVVTAAVVAALGSVVVATDNATLLGTEADIVASTAATLSSSIGDFDAIADGVTIDGRSTAVDVFLNFAAADAQSTADDTLTLSGTVTIEWSNLDE